KRGPHQPAVESMSMVVRVNGVERNLSSVYSQFSLARRRQTERGEADRSPFLLDDQDMVNNPFQIGVSDRLGVEVIYPLLRKLGITVEAIDVVAAIAKTFR